MYSVVFMLGAGADEYIYIRQGAILGNYQKNNNMQTDDTPLNYNQINAIPNEDELQFENEEL